MRSRSSRGLLSCCVAAAVLSGCGGAQSGIGAPGAMPQSRALAARAGLSNYKVLYSFRGGDRDGAKPRAGLIDVGGTLYGTTQFGGPVNSTLHCYTGCGTVFSITLGGTESVLHAFATKRHAESDGQYPLAGLIDAGGTLYGTTGFGGTYNRGTVFTISSSGSEQVLHSFGAASDGTYPYATLIDVGGTLYGTTSNGGTYSSIGGTVFSITTAGTENILYSFGLKDDGQSPLAGLVDLGGMLYGTTNSGGAYKHGTIFSVTTGGEENVLHSFDDHKSGKFPYAALVQLKGKLYGTTGAGGTFVCSRRGNHRGYCGTAFSIMPDGIETALYDFGQGADGAGPAAALITVGGKLYGTTSSGGAYGYGTVFSLTPGGKEKVLYSFGTTDGDGQEPVAPLIALDGTLYGTTANGGASGLGTVFALKL